MDFSKAFNTTPHERLLAKLHHAGIHGSSLHSWIRTFLKRSQQVALDGAFSSSIHVTSGPYFIKVKILKSGFKGPYADHILIPQGSTGSSIFFDIE